MPINTIKLYSINERVPHELIKHSNYTMAHLMPALHWRLPTKRQFPANRLARIRTKKCNLHKSCTRSAINAAMSVNFIMIYMCLPIDWAGWARARRTHTRYWIIQISCAWLWPQRPGFRNAHIFTAVHRNSRDYPLMCNNANVCVRVSDV